MMMEFIKGADVSSLQAMEDNGAKFYDLDGVERDALEILKRHGIGYIRLRIWNQPTTSFERGDYCNLENTVLAAKRVRRAGMKLLLDFHYSDTWADWKCQQIPRQWSGKTKEELAESVYEYTGEVLEALERADACPDMVQIGNEIGRGLLWDFGRDGHMENIALFLNKGIRAVRDKDAGRRKTKIMIHVEHGAETEQTEAFFQGLEEHGVTDYDVVGLSYYPYWAGPYEKLRENMRNIDRRFHKPVVVAETAFPYTDDSNDDMENVVTSELTRRTMGLEASVENQGRVVSDVIRLVRAEPNGYGVFYWEPVWYCVQGVGAAKGRGNEWENQAMFDPNGRGLLSLRAFES